MMMTPKIFLLVLLMAPLSLANSNSISLGEYFLYGDDFVLLYTSNSTQVVRAAFDVFEGGILKQTLYGDFSLGGDEIVLGLGEFTGREIEVVLRVDNATFSFGKFTPVTDENLTMDVKEKFGESQTGVAIKIPGEHDYLSAFQITLCLGFLAFLLVIYKSLARN